MGAVNSSYRRVTPTNEGRKANSPETPGLCWHSTRSAEKREAREHRLAGFGDEADRSTSHPGARKAHGTADPSMYFGKTEPRSAGLFQTVFSKCIEGSIAVLEQPSPRGV